VWSKVKNNCRQVDKTELLLKILINSLRLIIAHQTKTLGAAIAIHLPQTMI
jgi:hypothetical protein